MRVWDEVKGWAFVLAMFAVLLGIVAFAVIKAIAWVRVAFWGLA